MAEASATPSQGREKHSHLVEGGQAFWWTDRLWAAARDLPAFRIAIDDIVEFDMDCWFGPTTPPTCRTVAEHARRIENADVTFPVILSSTGVLMDGGHRLAKAWLSGATHVLAVRFAQDPPPDWWEPSS